MNDSILQELDGAKTKFIEEILLVGAMSDAMKTRGGRPIFEEDSTDNQRRITF